MVKCQYLHEGLKIWVKNECVVLEKQLIKFIAYMLIFIINVQAELKHRAQEGHFKWFYLQWTIYLNLLVREDLSSNANRSGSDSSSTDPISDYCLSGKQNRTSAQRRKQVSYRQCFIDVRWQLKNHVCLKILQNI